MPSSTSSRGMTCASCAARIEKRLNELDGVTARVNYATERAKVMVPPGTDDRRAPRPGRVDRLLRHARRRPRGRTAERPTSATRAGRTRPLRDCWSLASVLDGACRAAVDDSGAAVRHLAVVSLTLAAPVVTWAAWPFHRAAGSNVRHAAATMDTLISVGVFAAFGWSLYALFLGDAGDPQMRHGFSFRGDRDMGSSLIYLEVAAGVTTFILAGRYFEARAEAALGRRHEGPARARRQGRCRLRRARWELEASAVRSIDAPRRRSVRRPSGREGPD